MFNLVRSRAIARDKGAGGAILPDFQRHRALRDAARDGAVTGQGTVIWKDESPDQGELASVTVPEFGGRQTLRFMVPSMNVRLDVQSASFAAARWRLQSVFVAQTRKQ